MRFDLDDLVMDVLLFIFAAGFALFFMTAITTHAPSNQGGSSGGGGAGLNW